MVKLLWRLREQALAVKARARFIRAGKRQNWRAVIFGDVCSQGCSAQEGAAFAAALLCHVQVQTGCGAPELFARISGRRIELLRPARRNLGI